jgi:tRNA dimethylallyltransferase
VVIETSPPIIAITGATATGKTSLAIDVAEELDTVILSADSMQVYRGMDIGTAKPTADEVARVPHHLIDVADPTQPFSVSDYCQLATPIIEEYQNRGRPLVVCGGTGLYFKSLFEGLAEAPPPDFEFRAEMERQAEETGTPRLHERLSEVDPESAAKIHPNDRKRIIRALEILHCTGVRKTEFEALQETPPWRDSVRWFGLLRPWEELDRRIDSRVEDMFEQGLIEEVRQLVAKGCSSKHTSMQALGYKEVLEHLDGQRGLAETVDLIQQRTRRFARRQMTWFRPNPEIHWIEIDPGAEASEIARRLSRGVAPGFDV